MADWDHWEGDLNDDCTLARDGYFAHCEAMDRNVWWFAVYLADRKTELYHSNWVEHPVPLRTGKIARACAETVINMLIAQNKLAISMTEGRDANALHQLHRAAAKPLERSEA